MSQSTPAAASPTGIDLYSRFALAGAVCCSVTHAALCPVDVVKTRMQLFPEQYSKGMVDAFKQVVSKEGVGALATGLAPTAAGYFMQGALKFGGYEFWKKTFIDNLGMDKAVDYRTGIYLGSSAMAEFVADIALCPLEAARIKLVNDPKFASSMPAAFSKIAAEEGIVRGFYAGFGPMVLKQVPYTMTKFVVYELVADSLFAASSTPKDKMSATTVAGINLGSGLIAGIAAAIVSQPADTLLSKINKQGKDVQGSITSRLIKLAVELGPKGLFLGMGARILMVGTLTAGQFAIYGDIKRILGATGATEIAKKKN